MKFDKVEIAEEIPEHVVKAKVVKKTVYKCPKCDATFSSSRDAEIHYFNTHISVEKLVVSGVNVFKFASQEDATAYSRKGSYWDDITHGKSLYYVIECIETYELDDGYVEKHVFTAIDVWLEQEAQRIANAQYAYLDFSIALKEKGLL